MYVVIVVVGTRGGERRRIVCTPRLCRSRGYPAVAYLDSSSFHLPGVRAFDVLPTNSSSSSASTFITSLADPTDHADVLCISGHTLDSVAGCDVTSIFQSIDPNEWEVVVPPTLLPFAPPLDSLTIPTCSSESDDVNAVVEQCAPVVGSLPPCHTTSLFHGVTA